MNWTQRDAIEFVRALEPNLRPHYHVGLLGSCLHGAMGEDLDIVVYPADSSRMSLEQQVMDVSAVLTQIGLVRRWDAHEVRRWWRDRYGHDDEKHVEVWIYQRHFKVDVFNMR